MTPLEHDELLTKCQIFEKETVTRPEETNQRSQTESKETEHGGDEGAAQIVPANDDVAAPAKFQLESIGANSVGFTSDAEHVDASRIAVLRAQGCG